MAGWSVVLSLGIASLGVASLASCSGGDDGGDGGGASSGFCTDVRTFESLQAEGDALFEQTDVDTEQLRDVFTRFSAAIDALEGSAPDDVAGDVELVGETTQQLIDAYERADYDFVALATDPQYAEVLASLDEARVTEANDRLAVYVRERCGPPTT